MFPLKWPKIIDLPSGTVRHGKIHHAIKNGKPSILIRAIYTMAMLVITREYFMSDLPSGVSMAFFEAEESTMTCTSMPLRCHEASDYAFLPFGAGQHFPQKVMVGSDDHVDNC